MFDETTLLMSCFAAVLIGFDIGRRWQLRRSERATRRQLVELVLALDELKSKLEKGWTFPQPHQPQ